MLGWISCLFSFSLIFMLWYSFILMLYKSKFPKNSYNGGDFVGGISALYSVLTLILLAFVLFASPGALFHDLIFDDSKALKAQIAQLKSDSRTLENQALLMSKEIEKLIPTTEGGTPTVAEDLKK